MIDFLKIPLLLAWNRGSFVGLIMILCFLFCCFLGVVDETGGEGIGGGSGVTGSIGGGGGKSSVASIGNGGGGSS